MDNVACETFTTERAAVLISAIVLSSVFNIIAIFIEDLLIVVFHYDCHVGCAAVADFKVVSDKCIVKLI